MSVLSAVSRAPPRRSSASGEEPCLTRQDTTQLALTDLEWFMRFGYRRVVPGPAEEVRRALRPLRPIDQTLNRYLSRWPKQEAEFELPDWLLAMAEAAERESLTDAA